MTASEHGMLVLVATPIGNLGDLAPRALDALRHADRIYAEDTRRTRTLLAHAGIEAGGRLRSLHAHSEARGAQEVADLVAHGATVVYVSDAGMPGISDPGERLVRACAARDLRVSVVPGPSAALAALVVSGLATVPFTFVGFLARRGKERREALERVASSSSTTVLFESPVRLAATLDDLVACAGAERPAVVVRELTKVHEQVARGTLADLAAAVADGRIPARGECVVVVAAAPAGDAAPSDEVIAARIDELLAGGASARDAARAIAGELGLAHRAAYEAVTARRAR